MKAGRKPLRKKGDKPKIIHLSKATFSAIKRKSKDKGTNTKQYIEALCDIDAEKD